MRRSAFTLMELLIVISIMMILLGMIMGGVMYAKNQAMNAKTKAAIDDLVGILTTYRTVSGRFPDDPVKFPQLAANPPFAGIDWSGVNQALATVLRDAGQPVKPSIDDAWKKPLHYRPARFYPFDASATVDIDKEDPPGRDSFQLWSVGKDGRDEGGKGGSDDVTSWPK